MADNITTTYQDLLEKLIREVLDSENTLNKCADNGMTCMFCGREWAHRHESRGGSCVIHRPDCWIVRAHVILGKGIPVLYADKESDITGLDPLTNKNIPIKRIN